MKKMKMKLVLVLSCVLCVSADVLHDDFAINGCSDADGESVYGVDDEETWYADFVHRGGVEPQPSFIDHISFGKDMFEQALEGQTVCRRNLGLRRQAMKEIPLENDPPSSLIIYSRDDVELGQENTLICYVTGFYPAPVKVHWTRNGRNVTEGTSTNVPHPNKDGSFKQIFRLRFTPQHGDMFGCTVEHPALDQPLTRFWDVKVQPRTGPAVFCGLGLTVGLLGVATGTFFLIRGNECR